MGIDDLLFQLRKLRSDSTFHKIFHTAQVLAQSLDVELSRPRPQGRSVYRTAAGDGDVEEYYRLNVFFPTIDAVLSDIELRFGANQRKAASLSLLIPAFFRCDDDETEDQCWELLQSGLMTYYQYFLDSSSVLKAEYLLWRRRWERVPRDTCPSTALKSLDFSANFPNVKTALQILATLPISTAEAERVFSKVSKTLTAIRSSMTEARLEALILLQIHRDETPSIESVINRFATTSARRLQFLV